MKKTVLVLILLTVLTVTGCSGTKDNIYQFGEEAVKSGLSLSFSDYGTIGIDLFCEKDSALYKALAKCLEESSGKALPSVVAGLCIELPLSEDADGLISAAIEDEILKDKTPYPFQYTLCMNNTDGSLLIIDTEAGFYDETASLLEYKEMSLSDYFRESYNIKLSSSELELYKSYGGACWLKDSLTVIGSISLGREIIDEINTIPVKDTVNYSPVDDIYIENTVFK